MDRMEPLNSTSVAIDGGIIRRIREEKRLTQLYVAKVVGVTTDTVSRWENNRYPTIMRDNAQKLAEALEVDLDSILMQEDETNNSVEANLPVKSKVIRWILLFLVTAAVLCTVVFLLNPRNQSAAPPLLQAKRFLPPYAAPGSRILIQVELSAEKTMKGMILKETFPPGWRLVEAQPTVSHLDESTRVARWIFRKPLQKIRVYYILQVPEDIQPDSDLTFSGELIANSEGERTSVEVQTVGMMEVKACHWADKNCDHIIDDVEILELSDLTDEADSLHLDWDLIENIWEVGAYRWQGESKKFVPVPESTQ